MSIQYIIDQYFLFCITDLMNEAVMGRKKEYQSDDVLRKGLEIFWSQSYENLTIEDLVKHTGLNRDSMYKEFGNKQKFFEKVMICYIDNVFNHGPGKYFTSHQGLEAISLFMTSAIDMIDERGCFILKADAKYKQYPPPIQILIDDYKSRLETEFYQHLTITFKHRKTDHLVKLLLAFFIGAVSLKKRGDPASALKKSLQTLLDYMVAEQ